MKIPIKFADPVTPSKKKHCLRSPVIPCIVITSLIAEGSFYQIYLTATNTVVRASKKSINSIEEVKILKLLKGPFINKMLKWWVYDSRLYFEMEYCSHNLRDLMDSDILDRLITDGLFFILQEKKKSTKFFYVNKKIAERDKKSIELDRIFSAEDSIFHSVLNKKVHQPNSLIHQEFNNSFLKDEKFLNFEKNGGECKKNELGSKNCRSNFFSNKQIVKQENKDIESIQNAINDSKENKNELIINYNEECNTDSDFIKDGAASKSPNVLSSKTANAKSSSNGDCTDVLKEEISRNGHENLYDVIHDSSSLVDSVISLSADLDATLDQELISNDGSSYAMSKIFPNQNKSDDTIQANSIFDPFSEQHVTTNASVVLSQDSEDEYSEHGHEQEIDVPFWILLMMYQIATVLECVHKNNIVHLDIKPENILVKIEEVNNCFSSIVSDSDNINITRDPEMCCDAGQNTENSHTLSDSDLKKLGSDYVDRIVSDLVKDNSQKLITFFLCDFNISKIGEGSFDLDGDKVYMAPEVLKNKCFFKSDIYSLGLIYLELINDTSLPRSGEKYNKLRKNNFSDWRLDSICKKMLSKDTTKRPDAKEVSHYFYNQLVKKALRVYD